MRFSPAPRLRCAETTVVASTTIRLRRKTTDTDPPQRMPILARNTHPSAKDYIIIARDEVPGCPPSAPEQGKTPAHTTQPAVFPLVSRAFTGWRSGIHLAL